MSVLSKVCSKCRVEKSLEEFHRKKKGKYGRRANCKACVSNDKVKYYKKNAEKIRARQAEYYKKNAEKIRAQRVNYYKENAEKERAQAVKYYKENAEKKKAQVFKYQKENPEKTNAIKAKRRAAKLQRTPSYADFERIKSVYAACPKNFHVDHIIPLQGRLVSGLHVADNLTYLNPKNNIRKKNKFSPKIYKKWIEEGQQGIFLGDRIIKKREGKNEQS